MRKILLVDDDENILSALKRLFNAEKDWHLTVSNSPNQALELVAKEQFEVIISDYKMPGMNGVEFLVFSKETNPNAKRILLSGETGFKGLVNAVNKAWIFRYISKPVDSIVLKNTIENALYVADIENENKQLADTVRQQQEEIEKKDALLAQFKSEHPLLNEVKRGPDDEIYLEQE